MTFLLILANILAMNNYNFLRSPYDVNIGIAKRMRAKRKERKLTQSELSKRSKVSLGSIKRFEHRGEISLKSLIKIAFVLSCEEDFDLLFAKKTYTSIEEVLDERD